MVLDCSSSLSELSPVKDGILRLPLLVVQECFPLPLPSALLVRAFGFRYSPLSSETCSQNAYTIVDA